MPACTALAHPDRRDCRRADGVLRLPQGDEPPSPIGGEPDLHQPPALDRNAQRRATSRRLSSRRRWPAKSSRPSAPYADRARARLLTRRMAAITRRCTTSSSGPLLDRPKMRTARPAPRQTEKKRSLRWKCYHDQPRHAFSGPTSLQRLQPPWRIEADFFELEVEGGCPPISRVRLSRLAPEPQFPPLLGDDIVLNGDGMVGMFRFTSGHVDFAVGT
jgi:hypothetical protein